MSVAGWFGARVRGLVGGGRMGAGRMPALPGRSVVCWGVGVEVGVDGENRAVPDRLLARRANRVGWMGVGLVCWGC
jgi:hypothetical protein